MQGDYILLLTVIFSVLLLLIQRTERKSRFKVFLLVAITAGALMYYVIELRQIQSEALVALVIALVVNWLFYVVIGCYNPVKNSDDTIKVIGMDE